MSDRDLIPSVSQLVIDKLSSQRLEFLQNAFFNREMGQATSRCFDTTFSSNFPTELIVSSWDSRDTTKVSERDACAMRNFLS